MILHPMPTIQRCHVSPAGNFIFTISGMLLFSIFNYYSTHRIVGISTISHSDHRIAQTRELECTKVVLPQVQRQGMNT